MKKIKLTMSLPKPRNPYALAARQRQAGAHEQPEKSKRRNARQALKLALKQGRDDFPPFLLPAAQAVAAIISRY